ncbi:unnamed protein product, partial [Heterotrigona itama]
SDGHAGECGVPECKKKWLEKVPSCASIESADIECLEKLQQLAENEVYTRRKIAELESREEAYMRTLQQADELWCKLDTDAVSTVTALQEQLDAKTAANQRMADRICELEDVIEELRARLGVCRGELEKHVSVSKIEAMIGKEDDFADVLEKEVLVTVPVRDEEVGRVDDLADVDEKFVVAAPRLADVDIEVRPDVVDRDLETRPDVTDAELEIKPDVEHVAMEVLRRDLIPVDDVQVELLEKYGWKFDAAEMTVRETAEAIELRERLLKAQIEREVKTVQPDKEERIVAEEVIAEEIEPFREIRPAEEVEADEKVTPVEPTEEIEPAEDIEVEKYESALDIEYVEDAIKPIQEIRPVEGIEAEPAEDVRLVEHYEPTEQIKPRPVEEVRPLEDITPIEETKAKAVVEVTRPVEETRPVEDIRPVEETRPVEDIRPVEETRLVEDIRPVEETKAELDKEIRPTEEIKPRPAEEVRLIEETKIEPVGKITVTEEVKPRPVEDVRPIEEIEAEPVKEIRPIEEIEPRPVREIGPEEDIKPTETVPPSEPRKIEKEGAPVPKYAEDKIDRDNILVPRKEMLSWQSDVDTIRTTIATNVKEIAARSRQEATVKRPEEKFPEIESEIRAKPEVTEAEVPPKIGEKEVEVKPDAAVELKLEFEHPPEPPTTPFAPAVSPRLEEDAILEERLEETPKVAKEPEKMPTIPEVDEDEVPPMKEEEKIEEEIGEPLAKIEEDVPVKVIAEKKEIDVEIEEEPKKEEEEVKWVPLEEKRLEEMLMEEEEKGVEAPVAVEEVLLEVEVLLDEIKVPEEETPIWKEPPVEKEEFVPCICPLVPPPVSDKLFHAFKNIFHSSIATSNIFRIIVLQPTKKIEITQTEITRIETVQVVTQTVIDVETQTTPRITRQAQPQLVTITRAIDPDPETIERLLNYERPLKEQFAAMTVTESSHTHKSHISSVHISATEIGDPRGPAVERPFVIQSPTILPGPLGPLRGVPSGARGPLPPDHPLSAVLQTLRAEKKREREPERELRSIYYGKNSGELDRDEGKCNCCQCGRTMPTPLQTSRTQVEGQAPTSVFRIVSNVPTTGTRVSPGIDQTTQHEAVYSKCKLRKLQQTLRAQDSLRRATKKSTRDQEVYTCETEPKKALPCREKVKRKSADQSCMAKIPKAKPRRVDDSDEDQSATVGCACSGLIEVKPGVMKKVHCACGDPD